MHLRRQRPISAWNLGENITVYYPAKLSRPAVPILILVNRDHLNLPRYGPVLIAKAEVSFTDPRRCIQ